LAAWHAANGCALGTARRLRHAMRLNPCRRRISLIVLSAGHSGAPKASSNLRRSFGAPHNGRCAAP
jgi:hypothetical protein